MNRALHKHLKESQHFIDKQRETHTPDNDDDDDDDDVTEVCDTCQNTFASPHLLELHLRQSGHVNEEQCGECGRVFNTCGALRQHQDSTGHESNEEEEEEEESDGEEYECKTCHEVFRFPEHLYMHMMQTSH